MVDVRDLMPHRPTKHCVCVSVGDGKYLAINTASRLEYGEVKINASDYAFLNGVDRFLVFSKIHTRSPEKLLQRVGTLSDADAKTVYAKIQASNKIKRSDKTAILAELWRTFT